MIAHRSTIGALLTSYDFIRFPLPSTPLLLRRIVLDALDQVRIKPGVALTRSGPSPALRRPGDDGHPVRPRLRWEAAAGAIAVQLGQADGEQNYVGSTSLRGGAISDSVVARVYLGAKAGTGAVFCVQPVPSSWS
jgi:hypothetical protein